MNKKLVPSAKELKASIRAQGFTQKDIANFFKTWPSSVSNAINGVGRESVLRSKIVKKFYKKVTIEK